MRQTIIAAPPALRLIVLASANPLTRLIIRLFLLRPYPDLAGRGVRLANSLDTARALIEQARKDQATA